MRSPLSHYAFLAAIFIKGLDGAIETAAGLLIAITGPSKLYDYVIWTVAPDLAHSIGFHAAEIVWRDAGKLVQSSRFAIIYLISHGALKLAIAIGLAFERMWIFPLASLILAGFVGYLGWRAAEHQSAWLVALALFDLLTLALVLNEWRSLARQIKT